MGQETHTKRERRRFRQADRSHDRSIDLLPTCEHLNRFLTESLCREVFSSTRTTERKRLWSLYTLASFWTKVILKAPGSLTQAFEEALRSDRAESSTVQGTSQGFFNRSQTLKWTFMARLYHRYVEALTTVAPTAFACGFATLRKRFPEVWVVDGSRLDAIAHRLKILWDVRSPLLPGCLLAFYDLFRGYPRILEFSPDAAQAEMNRVLGAIPHVPRGTLLLGDRLYASVRLFKELTARGLWALCRLNGRLKIRKLQRLSRSRRNGGVVEDWSVEVGSGVTAPKQHLRYIRFRRGKAVYELLTNVLDAKKLPAETAMVLYPRRWSVERMFFDLKVVLGLDRFYAANPNGVAQQVYAAAMVYAAMRVAQSRVARKASVEPEDISPAKFFPRVAKAAGTLAGIKLGYLLTCLENPGRRLRRPDPRGRPELTTTLAQILVQRRKGKRRKRRFCKGRRRWKSFTHVPGGKRLIR